jgi:hypothetical protein
MDVSQRVNESRSAAISLSFLRYRQSWEALIRTMDKI